MAISYQHGLPAIIPLAERAGRAQAAREEEEKRFKAEQAQLQRQFQQDMRKMDYQFELEMEAQSRAWELEKMATRSRIDFERAEQQRATAQHELDSRIKSLLDAVPKGLINEDEAQDEAQKAKLEAAIRAEAMGLNDFARSLYSQILPKPVPTTVTERLAQQEATAREQYMRDIQAAPFLDEKEKQRLLLQAQAEEAGVKLPVAVVAPTPEKPGPVLMTQKRAQDIIERYRENYEIVEKEGIAGFGREAKTVPLAVWDPWSGTYREASAFEAQIYEQAKTAVAQGTVGIPEEPANQLTRQQMEEFMRQANYDVEKAKALIKAAGY